jgi:diguanylate cyclase (GGDEF)-like protein/PAS domain S-box-containing protein
MNLESLNHRRVLIVDDNHAIHEDFHKILAPPQPTENLDQLEAELFGDTSAATRESYELVSAFQGKEALEKVRSAIVEEQPFSLAFVDMRMPPGWDGLETVGHLWEVDPDLQIVICTAYSDHSREEIVARTGQSHRLVILKKPFDNTEIAQLACAMTEKWRASQLAAQKMSDLEEEIAHRTADIGDANAQLRSSITQLQTMSDALQASEERYALAARGANDGLWDWDLLADRVHYSARWLAIVGVAESQTSDTPDFWMSRIHTNDLPSVRNAIDRHLRGETESFESEHRLRLPGDDFVWVLCRGASVRDEAGKPCRFAGSLTDISRRKEMEDQLRHGAYYDRLTGLPNRALLNECLNDALTAARNNPDERFGVLFLDFDRFKVVNDSLGHVVGDLLLVAVANRLNDVMQRAWLGRGHMLARLGGDEFVVLVNSVRPDESLTEQAEAIHSCFEQPYTIQNHDVHLTSSIGIAICGTEYESTDEVLRDADTAMYISKGRGLAQHVVFNAAMREAAMLRLQLETDMRAGIRQREFNVVYQPIISVETGSAVGIEALARWTHPVHGPISPERFIAIAEESGLIVPLSDYIMRVAAHDLKLLQQRYGHADLCVNVNLSNQYFSNMSLISSLCEVLDESQIKPGTFALELTESVLTNDFDATVATIRRLRDLGVEVYLDDFGTGYSSLSCLKQLPLSGLKLDRSFVAQIGTGLATSAIIHAVVTLAGHLRLSVVAEGVETKEQMAAIIALECDQAQGFLLGRPMPLEKLITWLAHPPTLASAA